VVRENGFAGRLADTLAAAAIGAVAGYLIARHSSEIEGILHTLIV